MKTNMKEKPQDLMVPKSKTVSIFKKILYQTRKGNIDWRELDPDTYLADIGNTNIRLLKDWFGIYDSKDNILESLENSDLLKDDEDINALFECAKKSALKVYEKLSELEKTLDDYI